MCARAKDQPSHLKIVPKTDLDFDTQEFLIDRQSRQLSPKTLLWYRQSLDTFIEFLQAQRITFLSNVNLGELRRFILWLSEREHNPGGVRNIFGAVRALLLWYAEESAPEAWINPLRKVRTPKVPEQPLEPVSLDTLKKLLATCQGRGFFASRDRAIICFALPAARVRILRVGMVTRVCSRTHRSAHFLSISPTLEATMEEKVPTISEIVQQLPHKLQLRFNSLGNYVRGMIDEEAARTGREIRLGHDTIQLIQLAALVYSLDSFLRAGTYAARSASTVFEGFELSGFQVGTADFTKDNRNTRLGELLANELSRTISRVWLGRFVRDSRTMKELISDLIRELSDGETVD